MRFIQTHINNYGMLGDTQAAIDEVLSQIQSLNNLINPLQQAIREWSIPMPGHGMLAPIISQLAINSYNVAVQKLNELNNQRTALDILIIHNKRKRRLFNNCEKIWWWWA